MFDARPRRTKVVRLANVEISAYRLGPVKFSVGAPAAVMARFVIDEVSVRISRVAGRRWSVCSLLANDMHRSAAIHSRQRRLNRPSQSAIEAEERDRADAIPAGEDVRCELRG